MARSIVRKRKERPTEISVGGQTFAFPEVAPIAYLPDLGQDLWAVTPGAHGTAVISIGDLAAAKQGATHSDASTDDLELALADAATPESGLPAGALLRAFEQTQAILREIFGERAYVAPAADTNAETGDSQLALEAHYALPADGLDDVAIARHDEFIRRYSTEVPTEARKNVVLVTVASDVDYA